MAEKEIKWTAPEFEYHHKTHSWSWLAVIAAIILIGLALWQRNFLFAVFILISSILFLKLGHAIPRYLDVHLSEQGIGLGEKTFYPFDSLSGFATRQIDHFKDGLTEIILQKKHRLSTYVKILAPTEHIEEIRILLNKHLPEIEYEESFTDHLSRFLKF